MKSWQTLAHAFVNRDGQYVTQGRYFRRRGPFSSPLPRPTIDGRRKGVREGLEEQTMGMALAAKKLIEENKYCF